MILSSMEPYMRKVGDLWEVHGGGMMFTHHQLWQAQIKLHWLTMAYGSSRELNWRDDQDRKKADG
jgi:hypothetical protein